MDFTDITEIIIDQLVLPSAEALLTVKKKHGDNNGGGEGAYMKGEDFLAVTKQLANQV